MAEIGYYREKLRALDDWELFLLEKSGLPGPRGNLELAQAVALEGDEKLFRRLLSYSPNKAPTNSPHEFLAFCGVVGFGRLLAEGRTDLLEALRAYASDPRWRIREGVAMALQLLGEKNMTLLLKTMDQWSKGNLLEKRAAAAALCEPRLLRDKENVRQVLGVLDEITASLSSLEDRSSEEFKALKKGLGYCWSVAVAAYPEEGVRMMEKWFSSSDKDIIWIMKENLKKNRLARMDAQWVEKWKAELQR